MFETTDEPLLSASSADAQLLPGDHSSPEENMKSNDAVSEEESVKNNNIKPATIVSSYVPQEEFDYETTANRENFQEEEQEKLYPPLEDLPMMAIETADNNSDLADSSCAKKDAAVIINGETEEVTIIIDNRQEEIDERTDTDDFINDTFVSVELSSSPTKNKSSYEEVGEQQQDHPHLSSVPNSTTSAGMTSPQERMITDAAIGATQTTTVTKKPSASFIPTSTSNNYATTAATTTTPSSSLNITQPSKTTTRRRKILHHPLLSHLTKLPWDRLSNAGSACDVIFNCKYSMRQVEDEVREECRRGISGEGVYIEDNDRVGREDGYVNVSLNNSCSDYQYQEAGCEAGEFEQILGCCSMLDNDDDESDDDDDDNEEECVLPENHEMSQKVVQPMMGLKGCRHVSDDANQGGEKEERELAAEDKSWQQSNPSLDMLLYRQFLHE